MRAITINKLSGICDKVKSIVTSRANGSEALTATPLKGERIFKHPKIVLTFVCIAIFHLQGCSEKSIPVKFKKLTDSFTSSTMQTHSPAQSLTIKCRAFL